MGYVSRGGLYRSSGLDGFGGFGLVLGPILAPIGQVDLVDLDWLGG